MVRTTCSYTAQSRSESPCLALSVIRSFPAVKFCILRKGQKIKPEVWRWEQILNQIPWKQYNQAHACSTGKGAAPPGGLGGTVFI